MAAPSSKSANAQISAKSFYIEGAIDAPGTDIDKSIPNYLYHKKQAWQKTPPRSGTPFNPFYIRHTDDIPAIVQLLRDGSKKQQAGFFVKSISNDRHHLTLVHYEKAGDKHQFAIMETSYAALADGDTKHPIAALNDRIIGAIKTSFSEADYKKNVKIYVSTAALQSAQFGCVEIAITLAEEAVTAVPGGFMGMISEQPRNINRKDMDIPRLDDPNVYSINPRAYTRAMELLITPGPQHITGMPTPYLQQQRKEIAAALQPYPDNIEDIQYQLSGGALLDTRQLTQHPFITAVTPASHFIKITTRKKWLELETTLQAMFPDKQIAYSDGNHIHLPRSVAAEFDQAIERIPNYAERIARRKLFASTIYKSREELYHAFASCYKAYYHTDTLPDEVSHQSIQLINHAGPANQIAADGLGITNGHLVNIFLKRNEQWVKAPDIHPQRNLSMRMVLEQVRSAFEQQTQQEAERKTSLATRLKRQPHPVAIALPANDLDIAIGKQEINSAEIHDLVKHSFKPFIPFVVAPSSLQHSSIVKLNENNVALEAFIKGHHTHFDEEGPRTDTQKEQLATKIKSNIRILSQQIADGKLKSATVPLKMIYTIALKAPASVER